MNTKNQFFYKKTLFLQKKSWTLFIILRLAV
jgi:hypothetical protein